MPLLPHYTTILRGRAAVAGPLLDLRELVDEEDAFSLRLPARLHDPRAGRALPELLHEQVVVGRQHERHRHEVYGQSQRVSDGTYERDGGERKKAARFTQVEVFPALVLLGQGTGLLLQVFAVALDVLDHQVLPGQLVVVWEVVDHLVVSQPVAGVHAEHAADGLDAHPVKEITALQT